MVKNYQLLALDWDERRRSVLPEKRRSLTAKSRKQDPTLDQYRNDEQVVRVSA